MFYFVQHLVLQALYPGYCRCCATIGPHVELRGEVSRGTDVALYIEQLPGRYYESMTEVHELQPVKISLYKERRGTTPGSKFLILTVRDRRKRCFDFRFQRQRLDVPSSDTLNHVSTTSSAPLDKDEGTRADNDILPSCPTVPSPTHSTDAASTSLPAMPPHSKSTPYMAPEPYNYIHWIPDGFYNIFRKYIRLGTLTFPVDAASPLYLYDLCIIADVVHNELPVYQEEEVAADEEADAPNDVHVGSFTATLIELLEHICGESMVPTGSVPRSMLYGNRNSTDGPRDKARMEELKQKYVNNAAEFMTKIDYKMSLPVKGMLYDSIKEQLQEKLRIRERLITLQDITIDHMEGQIKDLESNNLHWREVSAMAERVVKERDDAIVSLEKRIVELEATCVSLNDSAENYR